MEIIAKEVLFSTDILSSVRYLVKLDDTQVSSVDAYLSGPQTSNEITDEDRRLAASSRNLKSQAYRNKHDWYEVAPPVDRIVMDWYREEFYKEINMVGYGVNFINLF